MILSIIQFLMATHCSSPMAYSMEPVQTIGKKKNKKRKLERQRKRIARKK